MHEKGVIEFSLGSAQESCQRIEDQPLCVNLVQSTNYGFNVRTHAASLEDVQVDEPQLVFSSERVEIHSVSLHVAAEAFDILFKCREYCRLVIESDCVVDELASKGGLSSTYTASEKNKISNL